MDKGTIKVLLDSSYLSVTNLSYIEHLYKNFLTDPSSVNANWCTFFSQLSTFIKGTTEYADPISNHDIYLKQMKILQLIDAFRFHGYRHANLDPLKLWQYEIIPDLDPAFYQLTEADFQKNFNVSSFAIGINNMKLIDLYDALKKTYCGTIGVEYMHITNTTEKNWIQQRIESIVGQPIFSCKEKIRFLTELTAAEGIERYLSIKFPGAKRFSLEGSDVLIPMLKEIVRYTAITHGTREVILGMAHRGRLNVLVNVLGKKTQNLFDEFSNKYKEDLGSGDVQYHKGFSSNIETEGGIVHVAIACNPSHLEIVNPVIMGSVRARIDYLNRKNINSNIILPVTIHGDAAISGQGVVQETLNMSKVRAYDVGGTVRIVINNQVGFTTSNPHDSRSTQYCTDIAKMIQVPIFHVNADDLEAAAFVARVALDFRNIFKRDVMIDLVCYRRHGHNEADEPIATQPIMYQKIKKHPTLREIYAKHLEQNGIITITDATKMVKLFRKSLEKGECVVKELRQMNTNSFIWKYHFNYSSNEDFSSQVESQRLQALAFRISKIPDNIKIQPLVAKIYHDRNAMARGKKPFDWGGAEMLSYATLVDQGISVRLSGEDTSRGTFFHRHAILYDQKNGSSYIPLAHVNKNQGSFYVWNSVLSEEAALAFEYGYSIVESRTLVIWEAQFGDFANGAQIVIDQFISSGEQKWGQMCNLVMLLPHGYEGQGPEHSSARLERYLQLCAEQNMQVCIPSTPAQIYHILRRQALCNIRRPLIIMTPKSLLRHPLAISSLNELSNGKFQRIISEISNINPYGTKRVVMCSGKIYYDLFIQRKKNKQQNIAIIRIEQLYPFPLQDIRNALIPYAHIHDFIWCQEEPKNQGAWYYYQSHFNEILHKGATLNYVGRPSSSSPAVGCLSVHLIQQKKIINDALNIN